MKIKEPAKFVSVWWGWALSHDQAYEKETPILAEDIVAELRHITFERSKAWLLGYRQGDIPF
jgi:hypothetical protein